MTFDAQFIETSHQQSNRPLWLLRAHLSDAPFSEADDLFIVNAEADIDYFKDAATAQTYTAFDFRHSGLPFNGRLELPTTAFSFANVNRDMQSYIEEHNGLRKLKLTIRVVYRDDLADPDAHREEVFYVDSATADKLNVNFQVTGNFGSLANHIPGRRQNRDTCDHIYKGLGCYIGGSTQPAGFLTDSRRIFDFLDISDTLSGAGTATASAIFRPWSLAPWGGATDVLRIDLKVTNLSNATLASGYVQIGTDASNGHRWTDLSALGLVEDTWKTIDFIFSTGAAQGTGMNDRAVSLVQAVMPFTGAGAVAWRNALGRGTGFDSCDKTLRACRQHNNLSRFGGFPGIQKRRVFVG